MFRKYSNISSPCSLLLLALLVIVTPPAFGSRPITVEWLVPPFTENVTDQTWEKFVTYMIDTFDFHAGNLGDCEALPFRFSISNNRKMVAFPYSSKSFAPLHRPNSNRATRNQAVLLDLPSGKARLMSYNPESKSASYSDAHIVGFSNDDRYVYFETLDQYLIPGKTAQETSFKLKFDISQNKLTEWENPLFSSFNFLRDLNSPSIRDILVNIPEIKRDREAYSMYNHTVPFLINQVSKNRTLASVGQLSPFEPEGWNRPAFLSVIRSSDNTPIHLWKVPRFSSYAIPGSGDTIFLSGDDNQSIWTVNINTGNIQDVYTDSQGVKADRSHSGFGASPDGGVIAFATYGTYYAALFGPNLVPANMDRVDSVIWFKNISTGKISNRVWKY